MKLHLGCGRYYLDGYTNIDYPPAEHTVQADIKADIYCDIVKLHFPAGSIEEIRLHHLFEHFSRPVALALLCRWRDWLAPGGKLHIETPDLKASAWLLVSPLVSYEKKHEVIRHLFGSHEAHWAIHWDGWYPERLTRTLQHLGFDIASIRTTKWGYLRNVEVIADKGSVVFDVGDYRTTVRQLLSLSTIKNPSGVQQPARMPASEEEILTVWMGMWEKAYRARPAAE
jgi:predicted SAM-dependent methyltransferase